MNESNFCPYANKKNKTTCAMYFAKQHPSIPDFFPEKFLDEKYKKNTCEDPDGVGYWKSCPMYKTLNLLENVLEDSQNKGKMKGGLN